MAFSCCSCFCNRHQIEAVEDELESQSIDSEPYSPKNVKFVNSGKGQSLRLADASPSSSQSVISGSDRSSDLVQDVQHLSSYQEASRASSFRDSFDSREAYSLIHSTDSSVDLSGAEIGFYTRKTTPDRLVPDSGLDAVSRHRQLLRSEEAPALGLYVYVAGTDERVVDYHQLSALMDDLGGWALLQVPGMESLRYKHKSGVDAFLPWPDFWAGSRLDVQKFVETVNKVEGRTIFYCVFIEHSESFAKEWAPCFPPPPPPLSVGAQSDEKLEISYSSFDG